MEDNDFTAIYGGNSQKTAISADAPPAQKVDNEFSSIYGEQQPVVKNKEERPTSWYDMSPPKNNAFFDALEGFNYQFEKIATGTIQKLAKATGWNSLEKSTDTYYDKITNNATEAQQRNPEAYGIGSLYGDIGSNFLAGTVLSGGGVAAPWTAPILGGTLGYTKYAKTDEDAARNAIEGTIGGVGAGMFSSALKYAPGLVGKAADGVLGNVLGKVSGTKGLLEKGAKAVTNTIIEPTADMITKSGGSMFQDFVNNTASPEDIDKVNAYIKSNLEQNQRGDSKKKDELSNIVRSLGIGG